MSYFTHTITISAVKQPITKLLVRDSDLTVSTLVLKVKSFKFFAAI